jgi:hypothetical protein
MRVAATNPEHFKKALGVFLIKNQNAFSNQNVGASQKLSDRRMHV